jgi:acyl-[acyl-carrier-protein] desaturase
VPHVASPRVVHVKQDRHEVMRDLTPVVDGLIETLRPVKDCWQPSDFLPAMGSPTWHEEVLRLRAEAECLSDEMLVVLVGNVVTEEALPSYLAELNRFQSPDDDSGASDRAWARWNRAWTAEEKRHGDVTRAYVYLSGRIDMKSLEVTVQNLLRSGFDTGAERDPYRGLTYAAFQEHATKTAWNQLGKIAGAAGAPLLHRLCGTVAADEARHERVYATLLRSVVERDPEGAVDAIHHALSHWIVMPASHMTDGVDRSLFAHFANVGRRLGVYTFKDYFENLAQLIDALGLARLPLGGDAAAKRDAICELHRTQREAYESLPVPNRPVRFQWIHGRRA